MPASAPFLSVVVLAPRVGSGGLWTRTSSKAISDRAPIDDLGGVLRRRFASQASRIISEGRLALPGSL